MRLRNRAILGVALREHSVRSSGHRLTRTLLRSHGVAWRERRCIRRLLLLADLLRDRRRRLPMRLRKAFSRRHDGELVPTAERRDLLPKQERHRAQLRLLQIDDLRIRDRRASRQLRPRNPPMRRQRRRLAPLNLQRHRTSSGSAAIFGPKGVASGAAVSNTPYANRSPSRSPR